MSILISAVARMFQAVATPAPNKLPETSQMISTSSAGLPMVSDPAPGNSGQLIAFTTSPRGKMSQSVVVPVDLRP